MQIAKIVLGGLASCLIAQQAIAADHTVKMLNKGAEGAMTFEPSYIKVEVGDTVIFTPAEKGLHNSASFLVPEGATTWQGKSDQEVRVKIDKEGVYLYVCEPHRMMAMVGVIQAGKPVNLDKAQEAAKKENFMMNKDRLNKALANVK